MITLGKRGDPARASPGPVGTIRSKQVASKVFDTLLADRFRERARRLHARAEAAAAGWATRRRDVDHSSSIDRPASRTTSEWGAPLTSGSRTILLVVLEGSAALASVAAAGAPVGFRGTRAIPRSAFSTAGARERLAAVPCGRRYGALARGAARPAWCSSTSGRPGASPLPRTRCTGDGAPLSPLASATRASSSSRSRMDAPERGSGRVARSGKRLRALSFPIAARSGARRSHTIAYQSERASRSRCVIGIETDVLDRPLRRPAGVGREAALRESRAAPHRRLS